MNWLPLGAIAALTALVLGRRSPLGDSQPTPTAPGLGRAPKTQPSSVIKLEAGGWYEFRALAPAAMSQPEAVLFIEEWGGQVASAAPGKRVALQFYWGPDYDTSLTVPGAMGDFYITSVRAAEPAESPNS